MSLVRAVILLFSILLVTQSIFGSPFKQNNHVKRNDPDTEIQGRQGSSSISTFKEGEEKNNRRVAVLGAPLGSVLKTILDNFGAVSRKVAIGVINNSGYKWESISAFIKHGTTTLVLPPTVPKKGKLTYGARKTSGYGVYGAEGVFTYYIPGIKKTLAVMFSVPFNYIKHKNRVDVKLYEGKREANKVIWKEMYNDPTKYQGNPRWYTKNLEPDLLDKGIRAKFSMSTAGEAMIEMEILPRQSSWKFW